jgi:hypothetical protein
MLLMLGSQLQRFHHDYRNEVRSFADQSEIPNDFPPYYVAAQIARGPGDHRLYYPPKESSSTLLAVIPRETPWGQKAEADGFKPTMAFIYPPFAALLLQPLGRYPWPLSLFLWRIALTAMVLMSIYLAVRLVTPQPTQTRGAEINTGVKNQFLSFVLIGAAVMFFFPFTETIFQGQIDPIILLSWIAGVYLLKSNRPVWSSLCLAVGTLVKVSPVIVIGVFLLRRQWKWLISYAMWCTVLLGISIWHLGWQNHLVWLEQVFPALSHGVPYFANKSIAAIIYEIYLWRVPLDFDFQIPSILFRLVSVLNLAIYLGTLFYFWKKNPKTTAIVYELIVLALVALVISPVTWRHHFLLALLPLIYLWLCSRDDWREWLVLAAATLAMGLVFLDFLVTAVRQPIFDLLLSAILPALTMLLFFVSLANYPDETSERDGTDAVAKA